MQTFTAIKHNYDPEVMCFFSHKSTSQECYAWYDFSFFSLYSSQFFITVICTDATHLFTIAVPQSSPRDMLCEHAQTNLPKPRHQETDQLYTDKPYPLDLIDVCFYCGSKFNLISVYQYSVVTYFLYSVKTKHITKTRNCECSQSYQVNHTTRKTCVRGNYLVGLWSYHSQLLMKNDSILTQRCQIVLYASVSRG